MISLNAYYLISFKRPTNLSVLRDCLVLISSRLKFTESSSHKNTCANPENYSTYLHSRYNNQAQRLLSRLVVTSRISNNYRCRARCIFFSIARVFEKSNSPKLCQCPSTPFSSLSRACEIFARETRLRHRKSGRERDRGINNVARVTRIPRRRIFRVNCRHGITNVCASATHSNNNSNNNEVEGIDNPGGNIAKISFWANNIPRMSVPASASCNY